MHRRTEPTHHMTKTKLVVSLFKVMLPMYYNIYCSLFQEEKHYFLKNKEEIINKKEEMKRDGRCPSRKTKFKTNRVSSRQSLQGPKLRRKAAREAPENIEKCSLFPLLLLIYIYFSCGGNSLAYQSLRVFFSINSANQKAVL